MNAQQIFDGLRSLRTVAEDVVDTITDNLEEVLDRFEDFVDKWEANYEDAVVEKDAPTEPTREEKSKAIYEYLVKQGGLFSPEWNPNHASNGKIPNETIDWAYDCWVKGDYSNPDSAYYN